MRWLWSIPCLLISMTVVCAAGPRLEVVHGWPQLPAGDILGQVAGLGCDAQGDVYVFHRGSRRWVDDPLKAGPIPEDVVCRFDGRTGELRAKWGAKTFLLPHGLFVDHRGHVWLTDVGLHQVFEYDRDGRRLREWGVPGVGGNDQRHFNKPTDVAVLADGSFYVSDGYVNSRVVKFSTDGRYQFEWGTKGTGPGAFTIPHGLAVDRDGRVHVADRQNDRIQIFSADGKFLAQWSERAMGRPYGLRAGPDGLLYVTDGGEQPKSPPHRSGVAVLDRSGRVVTTFGRWGNQDGQFMAAHTIAVAPGGEIYVGDITGQRVQKLRWTDRR